MNEIDAGGTAAASSAVRHGDAGPLVVTRLSGGLGNQLFQFAAGRTLAQRSGSRLVLDATTYNLPQERRKFALGGYRIDAEVVFDGYAYPPTVPLVRIPRPRDMADGSTNSGRRMASRLLEKMGTVASMLWNVRADACRSKGDDGLLSVFMEASFDYDPGFDRCGAGTYLVGYWQSHRYFDENRRIIVNELELLHPANSRNESWLARMRGSNSICVHVRRGDYLMAGHFDQHGVCAESYYRRAMEIIRARTNDPHFFVFSDDLVWSRKHISGSNVAYVDANTGDMACDELRLMASCKHHIIANSSLSWWGAWLGRHSGQIVVGPDPWFTARDKTPDLFPENWIAAPRD